MSSRNTGFTLIEILIVVAIIGIVAAIALPNYTRSVRESQKSACIANLKLLDCAIEEAKFSIPDKDIAMADLCGAEKFIKVAPVCPVGQKPYTELDPPTCPSLPDDHVIPPYND